MGNSRNFDDRKFAIEAFGFMKFPISVVYLINSVINYN